MRASRDGFNPKIFHKLCNHKTPTIVVIHSELNHVFGGFTKSVSTVATLVCLLWMLALLL